MRLHFIKLGEGFPLVILHGLFGLSDNWLTAGKALSRDYTVYLVDQRNHGRSPHSGEMSYELMSNDLFVFFKSENIRKAFLLGHSMGGKTAMQFTLNEPAYVEKLVVVDMALREYPVDEKLLQALLSIPTGSLKSRKEAAYLLAKHITEEAIINLFNKNLYWQEPHKLAWRFNLAGIANNAANIAAALHLQNKINIPTLFIKGGNSDYVTAKDAEAINALFSNARFETVEGAGHWIHAEKPEEFIEKIRKFIVPQHNVLGFGEGGVF